MSPIIFYTLILGDRRRAPVLPRPAGHQQRHGRAGRHDRVLQPLPVQELLHVPEHGLRRDARLAPVRRHPGRSRWSCSGPRAAGSTTRRSGRRWAPRRRSRTRPAPAAAARASWLRRRRPRRPRDATRSFALTFLMVAILAAFLSPILRAVMVSLKTPDQLSETNAPFLPSLPQTFDCEGKTTTSTSCRSTATSRALALRQARPRRRASSSTRRTRPPAPITWEGSWRTLEPAWTLAPAWENFADVWDDHRLPAAAVQHGRDRGHRDDRDDRLVHARRVRLRAVPVPRPDAAVHAADRDDLPAGAP